ncbi:MAG: PilT protein domain protein [Candidatus Aminicenantes bacterium]|nr:PilT protein domain protein [Candidatus Aminicenantes bacterium]
MVLVDTSVWVSHLQSGNDRLRELLEEGKVISHPYIIGELACGNFKNRREILSLLQTLPASLTAAQDEVLLFIEDQRLMGLGLGYVDVHLLASARLSGVPFWTFDKKLKAAAVRLRVDFQSD